MATLEEFKTLRGKLSEEKISSLASTYINDNYRNNKLFLEALKAEGINFDFTSKDDLQLDLTEKQQKIYEHLYNQHIKDNNKSVNELIRIGSEHSINLTPEDIDIYVNELSENDEFDDLELDDEALKTVAGGIAPLAIFLFAVGPGTLMGIGINQAYKKDKARRGGPT